MKGIVVIVGVLIIAGVVGAQAPAPSIVRAGKMLARTPDGDEKLVTIQLMSDNSVRWQAEP